MNSYGLLGSMRRFEVTEQGAWRAATLTQEYRRSHPGTGLRDRPLPHVSRNHREPVLLVAGGWGIVPFRSMPRHRRTAAGDVAVRLLYSARSPEDVIYRDELPRFAAYDEVDIRFALTQGWPEAWQRSRPAEQNAALADLTRRLEVIERRLAGA